MGLRITILTGMTLGSLVSAVMLQAMSPPTLALDLDLDPMAPVVAAVLPYEGIIFEGKHPDEVDTDEAGRAIPPVSGEPIPHPVATAQAGLKSLVIGNLGEAVRRGDALAMMAVEGPRGGSWFPYDFAWNVEGVQLDAPWYSGMAQGQALSLYVRLWEATGEDVWMDRAAQVWTTMPPRESSQRASVWDGGYLWIDEYAASGSYVVNGHIFGLFGVYDWWRVTGDPEAATMFAEGARTALAALDAVRRPGEVSAYCLPWCPPYERYHDVHIRQANVMARITRASEFEVIAEALANDFHMS